MNTTPSSTPRISSTTTSDGIPVQQAPPQGNWPMPDQQVDGTRRAGNANKRALVLAGGGAAGNAWELGLIAGLSDAGVDVTEADLIIGISAGATVAAQITSGTAPAELYAAILAEAPQPPLPTRDAGSDRGRAPSLSGPDYMEWSNGIIGSAQDASDMRRRMGAAALDMDAPDGSSQTRWRDIVAARLPSEHWPQQPVLITAVDARTGEPVVFDRHNGIDLVDAVAASTSAMTPYRIGEDRYINGGYRRSENADLAAGYGLVLVLRGALRRDTRSPLRCAPGAGPCPRRRARSPRRRRARSPPCRPGCRSTPPAPRRTRWPGRGRSSPGRPC